MIPRTTHPALPVGAAPAEAAQRPNATAASHGLSLLDRATLAAVVLLVIVVSIPRLRDMAIRANESDARTALRWMGSWLAVPETAPAEFIHLVKERDNVKRRLPDARVLEGTLSHHGYLFRLVEDADRTRAVVAWPLERGRTGNACYRLDERGLTRHVVGPDGSHPLECRWSGLDRPGSAMGGGTWSAAPAR